LERPRSYNGPDVEIETPKKDIQVAALPPVVHGRINDYGGLSEVVLKMDLSQPFPNIPVLHVEVSGIYIFLSPASVFFKLETT
jgi:hypothetical protein